MIEGIIVDHGLLQGLSDDDHTQYLLADGTRALAGDWNCGNNALSNVKSVAINQTMSVGVGYGVEWLDGAAQKFRIDTDSGVPGYQAFFYAAEELRIETNGDQNDYIQISTPSDIPHIEAKGANLHIHADGGTIDFDNETLATTGTITCEQLTSSDDITMAGQLVNTLAAADTKGLDIDGDTNPFSFAGTDYYFHEITRKVTGSGTDRPSDMQGVHTEFIWDYDYSGVQGTASVLGTRDVFTFDGELKPSFVPPVTALWLLYGKDILAELGANADLDSTNGAIDATLYGVRCYSQLTSGATLTQNTKALTLNSIGGWFISADAGATVAGAPTINYYGGKFEATGSASGTSTGYGGWFNSITCDTNYGVYSNAGSNVFITSVTDTCTGAETDLYIDDSDGHIGPSSSSEKYKENIRDVDDADIAGLYSLRARKFDSRDGTVRDTIGLIAEEVEPAMPQIVRYKKNILYRDVIVLDPNGKEITEQHFDRFETTDEPDGVNYSKLIVPMLREVQRLNARVTELELRN
jgi:hypothetical protein